RGAERAAADERDRLALIVDRRERGGGELHHRRRRRHVLDLQGRGGLCAQGGRGFRHAQRDRHRLGALDEAVVEQGDGEGGGQRVGREGEDAGGGGEVRPGRGA